MAYSHREEVTKEFILSRISEEDIFLKYLNIYPNTDLYFTNPLRQDNNPDCVFYRDPRGVLKFKDFAYKMNIDCFNLVQIVEQDVTNYSQALHRIARDFNLHEKEINYDVAHNWEQHVKLAQKLFSSIRVKRKEWLKDELQWWAEQGVSRQTLEDSKMSSLQMLWLNGDLIYQWKKSDPGYVQHFGENYNYKAYFPLRSNFRFLQNVSGLLQGWEQIQKRGFYNQVLIITQSNKARMAISEHEGIDSVAPLSETTLLEEETWEMLNNIYPYIFTLFDRDRAGMSMSQQMRKKYGTKPLLFDAKGLFRTKDEPKDWNDHHKKYGLQYMIDLIEETKGEFFE